ncbi:hypothetical protein L1887_42709 [Cichorium endivia]|nr:hypothetical protein L1887_42709 [Cichorium endivia]
MQDLLAHVVIAAVVGQLHPVARARQIDAQDLPDGGRRAVGHHQHAIGEQHRLVHVVGNEHDRGVQRLLDLHHRVLQMRARQGIERAKRFIHQQDFRLHRQRAGNADALLHAAGDLPRALVQGVPHLHAVEVVLNPLPALCLAHAVAKHVIDRQGHVVEAGEPRQQRMVLEHHGTFRTRPGDFAVIAN